MILLTVPMTEQLLACLHPCIRGGLWGEVGRDAPPPARQVRLPHYLASGADAEKIDAQLADGILTVRLPKRTEAQSRKIEIKS